MDPRPMLVAFLLLVGCAPGGDAGANDTGPCTPVTWYGDADGDGWGSLTATVVSCDAPDGFVDAGGDCDDADPEVYPGAEEGCDGRDWNCDGIAPVDADLDGYLSCAECDDADPAVSPDATEYCDGVDNDCDGETDEDVSTTFYRDADGDGFGNPADTLDACERPGGYVPNGNDCDDTDSGAFPGAAEVCDGADNDCDDETDEGC